MTADNNNTDTKTAVIFNEVEEMKYFIIDSDISHLNGVYVNSVNCDNALQDELSDIMYDLNGRQNHVECSLNDIKEAVVNGAFLIECGFIP